jgi:predicted nuclease with RNAse H fold
VPELTIFGIDLSGPSSTKTTAVTHFEACDDRLVFIESVEGTDDAILEVVSRSARVGDVVVGLDAPLSYQPGGGQRSRDAELRKLLVGKGLEPGSVMTPTFQRMAWLTLRGVCVARLLSTISSPFKVRIVEIHPSGGLALRGAPVKAVREFSRSGEDGQSLLLWLRSQGLEGLELSVAQTSHFVAACAGALSAWRWQQGRSEWLARAEPPWHPYDFAC